MRLDAEQLRYMSADEFRVLTAIEMGMKNHELVPTALIPRIARVAASLTRKLISALHKNKLVYHESKIYDGYRLTYLGYDYLALKALVNRGSVRALGSRIGVGKEADVYECINNDGTPCILKIHRLGRISFRQIKNKRDYLLHRKSASWLYLSRLAAIREYSFLRALHDHRFPVPTPHDHSRHIILMSRVDGVNFGQLRSLRGVDAAYNTLINLIVRLAQFGLIHCDLNEFNLIIGADEKITLIDFPQMVSTSHANAVMYFERDVTCVTTYFAKRFHYEFGETPKFSDIKRIVDLDAQIDASGSRGSQAANKRFVNIIEQIQHKRVDQQNEGDQENSNDDDDSDDDEHDDEYEGSGNGEDDSEFNVDELKHDVEFDTDNIATADANASSGSTDSEEDAAAEAAAALAFAERMGRKEARKAEEQSKHLRRAQRSAAQKSIAAVDTSKTETNVSEHAPTLTTRLADDKNDDDVQSDAESDDDDTRSAASNVDYANVVSAVRTALARRRGTSDGAMIRASRNVVKSRQRDRLKQHIKADIAAAAYNF